jgi:hypothetical protein
MLLKLATFSRREIAACPLSSRRNGNGLRPQACSLPIACSASCPSPVAGWRLLWITASEPAASERFSAALPTDELVPGAPGHASLILWDEGSPPRPRYAMEVASPPDRDEACAGGEAMSKRSRRTSRGERGQRAGTDQRRNPGDPASEPNRKVSNCQRESITASGPCRESERSVV